MEVHVFYRCPVVPAPLDEKAISPPLNYFCAFVKSVGPICVDLLLDSLLCFRDL